MVEVALSQSEQSLSSFMFAMVEVSLTHVRTIFYGHLCSQWSRSVDRGSSDSGVGVSIFKPPSLTLKLLLIFDKSKVNFMKHTHDQATNTISKEILETKCLHPSVISLVSIFFMHLNISPIFIARLFNTQYISESNPFNKLCHPVLSEEASFHHRAAFTDRSLVAHLRPWQKRLMETFDMNLSWW